jgi:hypothetical protein
MHDIEFWTVLTGFYTETNGNTVRSILQELTVCFFYPVLGRPQLRYLKYTVSGNVTVRW